MGKRSAKMDKKQLQGMVTVKNVEDIARDDRCKGHESPVCR